MTLKSRGTFTHRVIKGRTACKGTSRSAQALAGSPVQGELLRLHVSRSQHATVSDLARHIHMRDGAPVSVSTVDVIAVKWKPGDALELNVLPSMRWVPIGYSPHLLSEKDP